MRATQRQRHSCTRTNAEGVSGSRLLTYEDVRVFVSEWGGTEERTEKGEGDSEATALGYKHEHSRLYASGGKLKVGPSATSAFVRNRQGLEWLDDRWGTRERETRPVR